jgi:hypothetical protein
MDWKNIPTLVMLDIVHLLSDVKTLSLRQVCKGWRDTFDDFVPFGMRNLPVPRDPRLLAPHRVYVRSTHGRNCTKCLHEPAQSCNYDGSKLQHFCKKCAKTSTKAISISTPSHIQRKHVKTSLIRYMTRWVGICIHCRSKRKVLARTATRLIYACRECASNKFRLQLVRRINKESAPNVITWDDICHGTNHSLGVFSLLEEMQSIFLHSSGLINIHHIKDLITFVHRSKDPTFQGIVNGIHGEIMNSAEHSEIRSTITRVTDINSRYPLYKIRRARSWLVAEYCAVYNSYPPHCILAGFTPP